MPVRLIPSGYGIAGLDQPLDPCALCASHMPAFAVGAFFSNVRYVDTRPYRFSSRGDYLDCANAQLP